MGLMDSFEKHPIVVFVNVGSAIKGIVTRTCHEFTNAKGDNRITVDIEVTKVTDGVILLEDDKNTSDQRVHTTDRRPEVGETVTILGGWQVGQALAKACVEARLAKTPASIAEGGELMFNHTGTDSTKSKAGNAMKLYAATYTPGVSAASVVWSDIYQGEPF